MHECERTHSTFFTCIYIVSKNQKSGTLFVPKTACISLSLLCLSLRLSPSLVDLNPNPRAALQTGIRAGFRVFCKASHVLSVEQVFYFSVEKITFFCRIGLFFSIEQVTFSVEQVPFLQSKFGPPFGLRNHD